MQQGVYSNKQGNNEMKMTAQQALALIAGTHIRIGDRIVPSAPAAKATNTDKAGFPAHAGNPVWMD
jgi:hypothetical protein